MNSALSSFLVGQQELLAVKTALQRARKTQIVARLMVEDLAFHGVRATVTPEDVPVPPSLVRAVGTALAPARLHAEDLDVVDVRVVPLGEATARLLRRPIRFWPLGARRRSRCRALLRNADALL